MRATPDLYLAKKIKDGKVVPVISQQLLCNLYLGSYTRLIEAYADYVDFPFADRSDLLKMAKYRSIKGIWDDHRKEYIKPDFSRLREDYLCLAKDHLYKLAIDEGTPKELLNKVPEEMIMIDYCDLTELLEYPHFGEVGEDPLLILADMAVPIYLTTCYHTIIEQAIQQVGHHPDSEFCRWHATIRNLPSVFDEDRYEPSVAKPLVFHLLGLDKHPESLVLTEDDYLNFLIEITKSDQTSSTLRLAQAFTQSTLLFLGFRLPSWEFRVLFHGLIKPNAKINQGKFIIQLDPKLQDEEPTKDEEEYLRTYLQQEANLEIEWGEIHQYLRELKGLYDQIK